MKFSQIPRKCIAVDFYEQWSSLFKSSNWYDFTLIKIAGENSPYKGSMEVELALLGFQVTVTYTYDFQFVEEMSSLRDEIVADLEAATGAKTIHDPFGVLDQLDREEKQ